MIYLDNSATTRVSGGVRDAMAATLGEAFGNPSSLHRMGSEAEIMLRGAAKAAAALLRASEKEILFTSGGTESNNEALIGAAMAQKRRGGHVIISSVEHPSVSAVGDYLETQGFSVTRLPVDREGLVRPEDLAAALRPETVLVSVMLVNNEVGSRQPVEELAAAVKAYREDILFHTDAVQGYGKTPLIPKKCGVDLLTASGHKIHGPKGVGILYVREGVRILPLLHGGEQQRGLRSGTENMPGIVGFGQAAKEVLAGFEEETGRLYRMKEELQRGLAELPGVTVNGPKERKKSAPHIVSATFEGVRSEVLLHALEDKEIYASAGSACSSHKRTPSATLTAVGLSPEQAGSTLRFSFGRFNRPEEVGEVLDALRELLPRLRRFVRK